MKKLLTIFALLSLNIAAHEKTIEEAREEIRQSEFIADFKQSIKDTDLLQCHELLKKLNLKDSAKAPYIKLAQEIKTLRLQAHIAGESKFGILASPTSEILTSTKIGWAAMAAATLTGLKLSAEWVDHGYFHGYIWNDSTLAATSFSYFAIRALKNWFEARELKQRYFDALAVEELISNS
jgi:hypothetical protein